MTDVRAMSDQELIRLYGGDTLGSPAQAKSYGGLGAPKTDMSKLTDEQLLDYYEKFGDPVEPFTDVARSAPKAAYRGGTLIGGTPGALDALMSGGVNAISGLVGGEQHPRLFGPGGGVSNLIGGEVGGEGGQRLAAGGVLPTPGELETRISGRNPALANLPEPQTGLGKVSSAAITGGIGSLAFGAGGPMRSAAVGAMAGGAGEAAGQGAEALGLDPLSAEGVRLGATLAAGGAGNMMKPRDIAPTRAAIASEAKATFDASRASGQVISQPDVANFADDAIQTAVDMGQSQIKGAAKELTPKTEAVLAVINDASVHDQPLSELHNLRKTIGAGISEATPGSVDQKILLAVRDKMDDWIETQQGGPELMKGIKLWSRVRKSDTIGELMHDAELKANPKSGLSYEDALRQNFRNLARSDRIRTFNPDERRAIESVVHGGPLDEAMQRLAAFAPRNLGGIARSSAFGGAAYALGGPAAAAFPVVAGEFGRAAEKALVRKNAAIADMLVRGGAGTPLPRSPLMSGVPLNLFYGNMATRGPQ